MSVEWTVDGSGLRVFVDAMLHSAIWRESGRKFFGEDGRVPREHVVCMLLEELRVGTGSRTGSRT